MVKSMNIRKAVLRGALSGVVTVVLWLGWLLLLWLGALNDGTFYLGGLLVAVAVFLLIKGQPMEQLCFSAFIGGIICWAIMIVMFIFSIDMAMYTAIYGAYSEMSNGEGLASAMILFSNMVSGIVGFSAAALYRALWQKRDKKKPNSPGEIAPGALENPTV